MEFQKILVYAALAGPSVLLYQEFGIEGIYIIAYVLAGAGIYFFHTAFEEKGASKPANIQRFGPEGPFQEQDWELGRGNQPEFKPRPPRRM